MCGRVSRSAPRQKPARMRAARLERGEHEQPGEHRGDDVRRVPDLADHRRVEVDGAEAEHAVEPQVVVFGARGVAARGEVAQHEEEQHRRQRGEDDGEEHVVDGEPEDGDERQEDRRREGRERDVILLPAVGDRRCRRCARPCRRASRKRSGCERRKVPATVRPSLRCRYSTSAQSLELGGGWPRSRRPCRNMSA